MPRAPILSMIYVTSRTATPQSNCISQNAAQAIIGNARATDKIAIFAL